MVPPSTLTALPEPRQKITGRAVPPTRSRCRRTPPHRNHNHNHHENRAHRQRRNQPDDAHLEWRLTAWSNGRPAYRCRHGYSSAAVPDPARRKNIYLREDQILPHLAALAVLLARGGKSDRALWVGITVPAETADLIDQLRTTGTALTYDPHDRTLRADGHDALSVAIGTNH